MKNHCIKFEKYLRNLNYVSFKVLNVLEVVIFRQKLVNAVF